MSEELKEKDIEIKALRDDNDKITQKFSNIINNLEQEIERLEEEKESWKRVATKNFNEAEDYKAIIKEVREYIISQKLHKFQDTTGGLTYQERKLLETLDKGE